MFKRPKEAGARALQPKELFGYECPVCGQGTIRTQIRDYRFCKGGREYLLKDALLGVCDLCGETLIPYETQGRLEESVSLVSVDP
jgi:YgiT-type zinc finger domain-containing protein